MSDPSTRPRAGRIWSYLPRSQRSIAAAIAVPLVLALLLVAWLVPLPYTIYSPGPTINVLGTGAQYGGSADPILRVSGHKVYRDGGQLRMVTVEVTTRTARLGLGALLQAWFSRDDAVYPKAAVYPDSTGTVQTDQSSGEAEMVSSQDIATAVALRELGYKVGTEVMIESVVSGAPADGHLHARDVLVSVNGTAVTSATQSVTLVRATPIGSQIHLVVLRHGKRRTISFTPGEQDGKPYLGISVGEGYTFPFKVAVDIDPEIGGPSAGLMFALSIYDLLTPGSLTGGQRIAGTGEIEPNGQVAPIGGIQQKIPAAKNAGAKLFLVPADNCVDAVGADHGSMRLVKVTSFHSAVQAIKTWTANPKAALPSCTTGGGTGS
jgi:PDZ domain-containing protein